MNGLGYSNRPLSLSPQFFSDLPIEHLFRECINASHFNRHIKLEKCEETIPYPINKAIVTLRTKIISLNAGHALNLHEIQKVALGSDQCQLQSQTNNGVT